MYLGSPSRQSRVKHGVYVLDVHRTGVPKLGNIPMRRARALAQAAIYAVPLTRLDEPVVHPLDLLDRPVEDVLVERDGSVDVIHVDIERHHSVGHGLPPPVKRQTNKRSDAQDITRHPSAARFLTFGGWRE